VDISKQFMISDDMKQDKFEMVRYDINGEMKNDKPTLLEMMLATFIVLFMFPLIMYEFEG